MQEKICKSCGYRLSEFYHTGMLGCPNCYIAFKAEVELALKKIQGKTFHMGKTPQVSSVDRELLVEFERLKEKRQDAFLEMDFQKVKEIDFDIDELKVELRKRGLI